MIVDYSVRDVISDDFILDSCELSTSKTGAPYARLKLSDASGSIQAMKWKDTQQVHDLNPGDIVHANFTVEDYQGSLQANVSFIAKQTSPDVDLSKLIQSSKYDIDKMLTEIIELAKGVSDEWFSKLLQYFYSDPTFLKKFRWHPAAVRNHHNYMGGLLQHTLTVTKSAKQIAQLYSSVNVDLVVTAALLHDIGKLHEIKSLPVHSISQYGSLIPHVIESQNMVREACASIEGFPDCKRDLVCHCLLSHHRLPEYGSPVAPKVIEAYIVHACDSLDAFVEIYAEHLESNKNQLDTNGFTPKNYLLGYSITDAALFE